MGRPLIDIDPKEVFELAAEGFKIVEIAEIFGCHPETIGERFSVEIRKGKLELRKSLRRAQIKTAREGNPTMQIWLGKQVLGQADKTIDEYIAEAIEAAGLTKDDLLEMIKNKDLLFKAAPKRSFEEFCEVAGYPKPFPKQIEMMNFVIGETPARLLLGSRGYGKTDYCTIMGVAYEIYLDPTGPSNLIITKSKERNAAMLAEIESACMKNGVVFDKANSNTLRARGLLGKDHSVSAVTIKTKSLRGRHPKRVIMDDPVTEDDTQEAARLHVERVYNEISKLTPNVAIIGQPAHKHDLYAKLRGIVKTMEVPWGSIEPLDADLESQRLAGVSEQSIQMSYFLKVPEEGTSPFDKVRYVDKFPTGSPCVAFMDPSEGGDYTAVTMAKMVGDGVFAVGFVWKKAWNHCLDDLGPLLEKHGAARLIFETNCTGEMPLELLRKAFPKVGIIGHRAVSNKHSRIMAAGAFAHLIHLSKESHPTYLDHVVKYEYKSKYDDAPDSLASLLERIGLIKGKI